MDNLDGELMAKVAVVFHSVCGNTMRIAKLFAERLEEAALYRVPDADLELWQSRFPAAAEDAAELSALPVAVPEVLREPRLLIFGTPTCFGNMSAEMKAFLDATSVFYRTRDLEGKFFGAFATSGSEEGGAVLALQSLWHFAQHSGMIGFPTPLAAQQAGRNASAYGVIHHSGEFGDQRPDAGTVAAVDAYCAFIERYLA